MLALFFFKKKVIKRQRCVKNDDSVLFLVFVARLCARPWCVRVRVYLCVRIQFRGLLRGDSGVTRAGNEVTGEVSNALNTEDGLLTGETTWPGNFSQCVIKLCAVPRLGSVGGGTIVVGCGGSGFCATSKTW